MKKYMEYTTTQLSEIARNSKSKKEFLECLGYDYYKTDLIKEIIRFYKKNLRKVPDLLTKEVGNDSKTSKEIREFKKINYGNGCSVCHKTE